MLLLFSFAGAAGQTFEVASVKPSEHPVGPDYNNQLRVSPSGFSARNTTLRRLISEAYRVQLLQVVGPAWLDQNEYDVEARFNGPAAADTLRPMLRALLADRFHLKNTAKRGGCEHISCWPARPV